MCMFNSSQTNAATLPRIASSSLASDQRRIHQTIDIENKISKLLCGNGNDAANAVRPTYGAYTNNTLPRGPYLQYKFNDQQLNKVKANDNNNKQINSEFMGSARTPRYPANNKAPLLLTPNSGHINGTAAIQSTTGQCHERINVCNKSHDIVSNVVEFYGDIIGRPPTTPANDNHLNGINSINGINRCRSTTSIQNGRVDIKRHDTMFTHKLENQNDNVSIMTHYNYDNGTDIRRIYSANHDKPPCHSRNIFLQQIQSTNIQMASNLDNYTKRLTATNANPTIHQIHANHSSSGDVPYLVKTRTNYVSLADIVQAKEDNGISQSEGWALLCQSVQALQDFFLADTPSISRVLPLVNPRSLQITSRGRVVLKLMPATEIYSCQNVALYLDTLSFLSPEFLKSIGTKQMFTESDIEKMWIYSLGITLQKCIPSASSNEGFTGTCTKRSALLVPPTADEANENEHNPKKAFDAAIHNTARQPTVERKEMELHNSRTAADVPQRDNNEYSGLSSLDYVIASMCSLSLRNRATLMYLLDVISEYCRCYHQVKPFSHIAMDLFKEVQDNNTITQIKQQQYQQQRDHFTTHKKYMDDQRSDTDSGRSSAHGDREIFKELPLNAQQKKSDDYLASKMPLKVIRPTKTQLETLEKNPEKFSTIGGGGGGTGKIYETKKMPEKTGRIQVTKRRNEILKKRRSTIAVNSMEVDKAAQDSQGTSLAKSVNNLDCLVAESDEMNPRDLSASSMADLNTRKFATLPNLRVRRKTIGSTENLCENPSDTIFDIAANISKGPEFIANSCLPPHQIQMTDVKCQHRRIVSVLLLNGRTIKIACNSATTTAQQIFETVIKSESLSENFFLGICALIGGDFVFLPAELKIYKVAPQIWLNNSKKVNYTESVIFTLFLRIKFFLPTLRGISSLESRHLLYLQLRKSILESHILCSDDDLITLGGLALQSEIGDFKSIMKYSDYFTISHYLPEGVYQKRKEMAKYLRNSHYAKQGVHKKDAEQTFIRYVQEMKEYGLHLYSAIWTTDDDVSYDVYVAISLQGILIFQRSSTVRNSKILEFGNNSKAAFQRKLYVTFDWLEIENLCFSKHILCVVVRKSESLKAKDNNRIKYKFKMDGRKSYFAFNLASEHHKFYMKLRNSFISLKSLSDELNIPIISTLPPCSDKIKIQINPSNYEADNRNIAQNEPNGELKSTSNSTETKEPKVKSGSRVKNLKKSMLNDNKLIKLRNKFLKRSKSSIGIVEEKPKDLDVATMEESQNKENECPKISSTAETSPTVLSPNRNRVKMGTRVFSSQFLNKSFENIYDTQMDLFQFDLDSDGSRCDGKKCDPDDQGSDDAVSLKSTSVTSLYFSERLSESPLPSEAYVIHSSIKSCNGTNFFSLQNETISDSLLDKFNNISSTNGFNERVIKRVTVIKQNPAEFLAKGPETKPANNTKYATLSTRNQNSNGTNLFLYRSQESLNARTGLEASRYDIQDVPFEPNSNKLTLGISIIQGSDQHVYVKDLVRNGPGDKCGIQIGDQILAVNGISLLNLSYGESLKILQNTGRTVELVVSQVIGNQAVFQEHGESSIKKSDENFVEMDRFDSIQSHQSEMNLESAKDSTVPTGTRKQLNRIEYGTECHRPSIISLMSAKSMPDLPKVVATIPKQSRKVAVPRHIGLSRKYVGPVKYPVTPIRATIGMETQRLSLLADDDEEQVFI